MILNFAPPQPGWTFTLATVAPEPAVPDPKYVCRIQPAFGGEGGQNGQAARTLSGLVVGQSYPLYARVNFDLETDTASRLQLRYNLSTVKSMVAPTDIDDNRVFLGWEIRDLGSFLYTLADRTFSITRPDGGGGLIDVHAIGIGERLDAEELLMRSTALDFMDRLKGLVEAIDQNIGSVFTTSKRWDDVCKLEDNGVLTINAAGILDDITRVGRNVTRFWFMTLQIDTEPLTNGSAEYQSTIMLTGFYTHEHGDAQITTLNRAAIEILDTLNTKVAELTTLNTGPAYLGFLMNRPQMGQVQHAALQEPKVIGNAVTITVRFAEEVSYA